MNESGTTLQFYDVGYPTDQGPCGAFSGTFDIDRNGNIEAFVVEALAAKDKDRRFDMPKGDGPFADPDVIFAYNLGNQIRADYDREVKDAMWDMTVSAREAEWESRDAAE
jgi:hypothetical protein